MENTQIIEEAYIKYLLRNGKEPISVLQFCELIEISEADFFANYNSFKAVEKSVWKNFVIETIEVLNNDADYHQYSAREKTLAFFYTHLEILKQNRSLVLFRLDGIIFKKSIPFFLVDYFKEFKGFMNEILGEAIENQEIVARPIISDQYVQLYNLLIGYVLRVWINDSSEAYQTTDAAIEKTVNLTFDLLQKGPIDSIIDFVKFAYQNKAY